MQSTSQCTSKSQLFFITEDIVFVHFDVLEDAECKEYGQMDSSLPDLVR